MPRAYVGDRQDRPLAVVFDPKGRLQFSKNGLPTGEHVVAVLDPKIDEAHLARLRRAGVSYVFQGDGAECTEREKLSAALAALEETFGVKRLLLEGGGVLNGSFFQEAEWKAFVEKAMKGDPWKGFDGKDFF